MQTPDIYQFVKLKPNAKSDLILNDGNVEYVWFSRLGKYIVKESNPYWKTKLEALEAAKRFKIRCEQAIKNKET
jgi:hypothetical protein